MLAVRHEVDGVALPHRPAVRARPVGDLAEVALGQAPHPDRLRLAALVALPGGELAADAVVGDALAVGRERGEPGAVDRQPLLGAAVHRHAVDLVGARRPDAARAEEDGLAVGEPVEHQVGGGVPGEPPRRPAGGRHHVDVGAAVVAAGEGDLRAVGAELGVALLARVAGQPPGVAAGGRGEPEVALVGEDHALAVHVGEAHEVLGGGRRAGDGPQAARRQARRDQRGAERRPHGCLPARMCCQDYLRPGLASFQSTKAPRISGRSGCPISCSS